MSEGALAEIVSMIMSELKLRGGDHLLEVGCGAGMVLKPLSMVCKVSGIDYAQSLIDIISEDIPEGKFSCCEANELPFEDGFFDKALSFGIFHYFPSYEYATEAVDEMLRCTKTDGRIFIGDVPDLSLRERYEEEKASHQMRYDFKNDELNHRYYPRAFFERILKKKDYRCKVVCKPLEGYGNSKYRFNVTVDKSLDYLDPVEWYWR